MHNLKAIVEYESLERKDYGFLMYLADGSRMVFLHQDGLYNQDTEDFETQSTLYVPA